MRKAINQIDRAQENMVKLDMIADGRHPRIDEHLPGVVTMLEECKNVLSQFRDEI